MLSTTTKRRAKGQSSKRKAGSAEIGSNKKQSRGNTKSGAVSNPELVIGIDFGTSSTAVAWAEVNRGLKSKSQIPINLIQNWPHKAHKQNFDKVPSQVLYTDDEGSAAGTKWGFLPHNWEEDYPGCKPLKWIKLRLEPTYERYLSKFNVPLEDQPRGKSDLDFVADYLTGLKGYIDKWFINKKGPGFIARCTPRYVFTVPAIWSDYAKSNLLLAAEMAGFESKYKVQLVSEPEAAALAEFREHEGSRGFFQRGDVFMVVDCGGGTADLISYKIESFSPHLKVCEVTKGDGGASGSIFINNRFSVHLEKTFGKYYYEILECDLERMMEDFEDRKREFRDDDDLDKYTVIAPRVSKEVMNYIEVEIDPENPRFPISRDKFRSFFDPSVNEIIGMIQKQYAGINERSGGESNVKAILLVGGFGDSEYLIKRIRDWTQTYPDARNTEVIQSVHPLIAVVKGAVMHGIESKPAWARIARRSYGFCTDALFDAERHSKTQLQRDMYDGEFRVPDQLDWFIKKGETVTHDYWEWWLEYVLHIPEDKWKAKDAEAFTFTEIVYVYEGDDKPTSPKDPGVFELCKLVSDLRVGVPASCWKRYSGMRAGSVYYELEFELTMRVIGERIEFQRDIDGAPHTRVAAKFI